MKSARLTVTENAPIAQNIHRMRLTGDTSAVTIPGTFVNLRVENAFLRRPISVCDRDDKALTLLYRVVGKGTRWLSEQTPSATLDALTGLGNGFDLATAGTAPLLVGGGIGTAPLYWLARALRTQGTDVFVIMGFRTEAEVFYEAEFRSLGCHVAVVTEDGGDGTRGLVTDVLPEGRSALYACGPLPMLRALFRATALPAQFSLEERMGCGFGACMGCTCRTTLGAKRVCRDGPVFRREELPWQTRA